MPATTAASPPSEPAQADGRSPLVPLAVAAGTAIVAAAVVRRRRQ